MSEVTLETVLNKRENVVFRNVGGKYLLVPIVATVKDVDAFYTINETGVAIWDLLDGVRSLAMIVDALQAEYEGERSAIESAVLAFVGEMLEQRLVA